MEIISFKNNNPKITHSLRLAPKNFKMSVNLRKSKNNSFLKISSKNLKIFVIFYKLSYCVLQYM